MALKDGGIVILDYGSQTAQLIARRVRELGVFAALVPYDASAADAQAAAPAFRGVILSDGPAGVYEPGAPTLPDWVLACGCRCSASATGCSCLRSGWVDVSPRAAAASMALLR